MNTKVSVLLRTTALLAVLGFGAAGCARQVTRIAPEQAIDLSGRWNDVDSRLVADEMIRQSLDPAASQNWALRYMQQHSGRQPTVIVGTIRNRSMEHIPVGTFSRDLERAYVNSGMVQVVADRVERGEVRDEREDQQEHASADTRARLAREIGATYMLQGDVQSIEDRERGRSVVFYQVDMTLVDLESNAKVWVGQHKIKKFVQRPRIAF
ncbi:MAG: penicillin-binding protein activator LpoB [Gemmatimonadetes bacterium]|nr:penicillin-binding protein activator LpoB [Gemmatimonadota bacterium]